MVTVAPYGSWRSPVTAQMLVERAVSLSQVVVDGGDVYWNEGRPAEAGRQVIVRLGAGADAADDVLPPGWSARTLAHEYGGQSYAVHGGTVCFSNFADQRLWSLGPGATEPEALTPEPPEPRSVRFADPSVTPDGRWVLCVRERHSDSGVVNDLVAVATDGSGRIELLADGHDFFSAPRVSPDGARLAWLSWNHPDMPWDGTELRMADFDGASAAVSGVRLIAGGREESVTQPRWSPGGVLHYVSDRTGWWNLYTEAGDALAPMDAEFSGPDWVFGQSTYTFLADGRLVASWGDLGGDRLGVVDAGSAHPIDVPFTFFDSIQPAGATEIVAVAGSPERAAAVVRIDIDRRVGGEPAEPEHHVQVLRRSRDAQLEAWDVSVAAPVEFPTAEGRTAHALFYAPRNHEFAGPDGDRPPLVVMSHGGPTSATAAVFNLAVQYWTTRGIAVVDVNYGGSTGYGREYRERLAGTWGIVDVDDCVNAALHLADRGEVDGDRMVIRGGSAGGFTTLAALAFRDVFAAGASLYGVGDLGLLARDTHKFEARYLDKLVGPWPEAEATYRERSPLFAADRISCPVILFQGLEDKVVPPEQSEGVAEALRTNGIPYAYLAFEGEQHGFRKAETIVRVAEAELAFYGRVLGFVPAGDVGPVAIENEEALAGRGRGLPSQP